MSRREHFDMGTFNPGRAMQEHHHLTMDYIHTSESERHRSAGNDNARMGLHTPKRYAKANEHMKMASKASRKRSKISEKTRRIKPAKLETATNPRKRNSHPDFN